MGVWLGAGVFVASTFIADALAEQFGGQGPRAVAAALLPALALTLWWAVYIVRLRHMDEFERNIEYRALAVAAGAAFWIATVWGVLQAFASAPELPLHFIAPLGALAYGAARFIMGLSYR